MARHVCICLGRSENAVNSHWDTSNLLYVRYWIDSDAESHKIKHMTGNRSHWRPQITSAVRWNLETNSSWLIRGIWHFSYFSSPSQDWESPIRYPYLCSEPLIHHFHLLMSQWARQRTASSGLARLRSQILHRRWTGSRFMWPKKVHCVSISGRAAAWALRSKSQLVSRMKGNRVPNLSIDGVARPRKNIWETYGTSGSVRARSYQPSASTPACTSAYIALWTLLFNCNSLGR